MSSDDQTRWDRQYALSAGADQPSSFLRRILDSDAWDIPRGLVLDVAAGTGRNAIFLAERGFRVVAIDNSSIALDEARRRAEKKSLAISWQQADLEQIELPQAAYDLIVNFNYLQRSLFPQIRKALKLMAGLFLKPTSSISRLSAIRRIPPTCSITTNCWSSFVISEFSAIAKASTQTLNSRHFAPVSLPRSLLIILTLTFSSVRLVGAGLRACPLR